MQTQPRLLRDTDYPGEKSFPSISVSELLEKWEKEQSELSASDQVEKYWIGSFITDLQKLSESYGLREGDVVIPKLITKRSEANGFDFNYYLHITGGSGNWKGKKNEQYLSGGEYDYCIFYASPDEMEGCNICYMKWCQQKDIVYGLGDTINEAYENYKIKSLNKQQ